MITKRRLALLSSLSAAPAFAAPFLAIGDNAELFLTARSEVRYEDNITYSSANELADEAFELVPGVEVLFGKNSLTKGSFSAFERVTSYSEYTNLNSNLTNLVFDSSYDGARLDLGADASFRELNQNSRDARFAATLVRRDTYNAGVDGEYALTEKSKLGLAGRYNRTQYKTAGLTDQSNYTVPVNYFFAITEKVDLSAGYRYRQDDVNAVDADSDNHFFNIGARGEFTPKLSGKFSVGYNLRDPEASGREDEKSIGLNAGFAYAYSPKTNITLDLLNDFETGSDTRGYETSSITVGASTSLTAALVLRGSVGYSMFDYLSGGGAPDREDDYIVLGLGFSYIYNDHVNFDAGYALNDNDSELAGASFTANVFRVGANFRY
jgi:polysaccharide biosynthesis protein VpsM